MEFLFGVRAIIIFVWQSLYLINQPWSVTSVVIKQNLELLLAFFFPLVYEYHKRGYMHQNEVKHSWCRWMKRYSSRILLSLYKTKIAPPPSFFETENPLLPRSDFRNRNRIGFSWEYGTARRRKSAAAAGAVAGAREEHSPKITLLNSAPTITISSPKILPHCKLSP